MQMSGDVHAATGERVVANAGALGDRALPFPFCAYRMLDFTQRQTVHHVRFRQPAFARDADPEP